MPLENPFFQRAMLASGLAALVCAVVGTFVVLKGLAFMGDAVAHSSLAGMSVAFLFGGRRRFALCRRAGLGGWFISFVRIKGQFANAS